MKKPLLNEIERMVVIKNDSLYADRLKLHLAVKNFNRACATTKLFKTFNKSVARLNELLTLKTKTNGH